MPRRANRRFITELVRLANGNAPRGMFSHAMREVTDGICKKGLRRQVQFLLNHLGPVRAQDLVENLLKFEQEVNNLTSQAVRDDRLRLLVRTMYDLKMKEAHQIAHAKPRIVVRQLIRTLGIDKVKKLVNGVE